MIFSSPAKFNRLEYYESKEEPLQLAHDNRLNEQYKLNYDENKHSIYIMSLVG